MHLSLEPTGLVKIEASFQHEGTAGLSHSKPKVQAHACDRGEALSLHINQKSQLWHHCPACAIMTGWSLCLFLPPSTRGPVLPGFLVPTLMKDLNVPLLPCGPTTFLFGWIIVIPCDGTAWAWFWENDPPSNPGLTLGCHWHLLSLRRLALWAVWAPWALHSLPTLALVLNSVFLV